MFQFEVLHAEDIVERLEAEAALSSEERKALPSHSRVAYAEWEAWSATVVKKLKEHFPEEVMTRYEALRQIYVKDSSDELSATLSHFHRMVQLLRQLDAS
jgi:hypothetical protein